MYQRKKEQQKERKGKKKEGRKDQLEEESAKLAEGVAVK